MAAELSMYSHLDVNISYLTLISGGGAILALGKLSQPELNSKVWHKKDFKPPTPQTQCHQYLNCSWPDFNQTLKVGFWDQQQLHEQEQEQVQEQEVQHQQQQ